MVIEHSEDKKEIPIYKTPLPQRYNPYGEWTPLYPISGLTLENIDRKVKELTKDVSDQRVKGVAKYIIATNLPVIEFVVKAKFSLEYPDNGVEINGCHFHLRKIDTVSSGNNVHANLQVYDGTFELPFKASTIDCEAIADGLYSIDVVLNRFAFSFDTKIEWVLKYNYSDNTGGVYEISNDDHESMKKLVCAFKDEDGSRIDSAISWYLNAKKIDDVLVKYLYTYIALESLVFKLVDGELEVSNIYGFTDETKYKKSRFLYHHLLKIIKKLKIVSGVSNNKKTRRALVAIFGTNDERFRLFYKKYNYKKHKKKNLYDIRNDIAHGKLTSIDREDRELVERRVYDLVRITHDFILRVLYMSKPDEKVKKISPSTRISIMMADPRSCSITTDIAMIKRGDWRIRLEWLF